MNREVFKVIELVGSSPDSVEDAIQAAINRASDAEHRLKWFEVVQIRGAIENGSASKFQVTLKVGCKIIEGKGD
jgi:flavin-binding protein dodecin